MLNVQVDSRSMTQLIAAKIYYDTLPNRISYAQAQAMMTAKMKMKDAVSPIAKAAKYLQYELIPFGAGGIKLRIKPYPKSQTGKNGRNIQIASAILLTGRKGGGTISADEGLMKTRPASVAQGYAKFYKEVRQVAIASKRNKIKEAAAKVIREEIKRAFSSQGFTSGGSVKAPTRDVLR
jgi:hypothetical protein